MRPKILHLIGQMVRGGAERQLLLVCTQLSERGWPQAVVTFHPGSPWDHLLKAKGIPLLSVPPSRLKVVRLLRLAVIIARERPAIVHSWSHHTNVYSGHAHRLFGFMFIASLRHNPLFDCETGQRLEGVPHAASYSRADCVLSNSCVSLGMARAAGLRPRSEALVGNIVAPQVAGNPGLDTSCPRIITVGNLTELKGHHDLFRSLGILADEGLDFRLSVVGDGPRRGYLEALATELQLQRRIEFLGELDDRSQVVPKCQLMVHASRMEGLSNAILEGMSSGLAVCATAVGTTPEYIEDGITGLLVPSHSPRRLADRLRELLRNPELRSRLGHAAREKVSATCSPSAVVAQYENCYRSLLEKPGKKLKPEMLRSGNPISGFQQRGTKVLMYHNILEGRFPGVPVASHQATVDGFRRQMLLVRDKVVNPEEVHEAISRGQPMPKGILVTFDDGASGVLRASEILAELGLSGVAFICPGALEKGLWFYRLADALARTQAKRLVWRGTNLSLANAQAMAEAYRILYQILSCELSEIREESLDDLIQDLRPSGGMNSELALSSQKPPSAQNDPAGEAGLGGEGDKTLKGLQILDELGLRRAAANGSLYFANHTWSHPNLTALPEEQIHKEIQLAGDWLQKSGLPTLPWLAFPQGYYDDRVLQVVKRAGLIPFGTDAANSCQDVFTRIGIYSMDSHLARFRLKLLLKPAC